MTTTLPAEPATGASARHRATPARVRWRRPSAGLLCVLAVVLVAAVPRLLLADFGLPDVNHPDEPTNITVGENMVRHGSLLPGRYNYPSFLFDLIASVVKLATLFGHELGETPIVRPMGLFVSRASDPGMVLALRLCSVAGSLVTAAVIAVVLLRATGSRVAAVVGALLLALSPTAIESSVYVTPDTWTGLFCALALAGALAVLRTGSLRSYLWCGLAIGLAFGAKYNAVLVAVALLAAHLLRHRRAWWRLSALGPFAAATGTAVVATLITTPAWLAEPRQVWRGLSYEVMHYSHGQPGHEGSAPAAYARVLVGSEPLLLLLAALALAAVLRWSVRFRAEVVVAGSFAVVYLLLIGSQTVSFDRNLLPALPALALLAGFAVASVRDRLDAVPDRSRLRRAAAAVLGVAMIGMGSLTAVRTHRLHGELTMPARLAAQHWVQDHLRPTTRIVEEASGPWLEPGVWTAVSPRFAVIDGPVTRADTLILTQDVAGRYAQDPGRYARQLDSYQRLRSTRCLAARFDGPGLWVEILVPCR